MMGEVFFAMRSVEPLFVWMPQVTRLCDEFSDSSLE